MFLAFGVSGVSHRKYMIAISANGLTNVKYHAVQISIFVEVVLALFGVVVEFTVHQARSLWCSSIQQWGQILRCWYCTVISPQRHRPDTIINHKFLHYPSYLNLNLLPQFVQTSLLFL